MPTEDAPTSIFPAPGLPKDPLLALECKTEDLVLQMDDLGRAICKEVAAQDAVMKGAPVIGLEIASQVVHPMLVDEEATKEKTTEATTEVLQKTGVTIADLLELLRVPTCREIKTLTGPPTTRDPITAKRSRHRRSATNLLDLTTCKFIPST